MLCHDATYSVYVSFRKLLSLCNAMRNVKHGIYVYVVVCVLRMMKNKESLYSLEFFLSSLYSQPMQTNFSFPNTAGITVHVGILAKKLFGKNVFYGIF